MNLTNIAEFSNVFIRMSCRAAAQEGLLWRTAAI
jgi:hypothetical protein